MNMKPTHPEIAYPTPSEPIGEPAITAAGSETRPEALWSDERGGHTLEWTLLLAVIGIPSYLVITMLLSALAGHYQMMAFVNSLPFP